MVAIGESFKGNPYEAGTLEVNEGETLVINLFGLDCTTFVENTLALSRLSRGTDHTFKAYLDSLKQIRYRDGNLDGYSSRLHYFTDWIRNKEEMGMVKNITFQLGGLPLEKSINFMSTHRSLYPGLSRETAFQEVVQQEKSLSDQNMFYLPAADVPAVEDQLRPGDIVAFVTDIPGLDVTHTGILIEGEGGRIHLLHASTQYKQVTISKRTLADYTKGKTSTIGIMVARPLDPTAPSK